MTIGQIKLRMLDLRGMEVALSNLTLLFQFSSFFSKVALVGPNGRDTMREQLTRSGTKLLYDEENLVIEKNRTW